MTFESDHLCPHLLKTHPSFTSDENTLICLLCSGDLTSQSQMTRDPRYRDHRFVNVVRVSTSRLLRKGSELNRHPPAKSGGMAVERTINRDTLRHDGSPLHSTCSVDDFNNCNWDNLRVGYLANSTADRRSIRLLVSPVKARLSLRQWHCCSSPNARRSTSHSPRVRSTTAVRRSGTCCRILCFMMPTRWRVVSYGIAAPLLDLSRSNQVRAPTVCNVG